MREVAKAIKYPMQVESAVAAFLRGKAEALAAAA